VSSGAAIYVKFGNIGLKEVTFRNNVAQNGGALDLDCEIEEDACAYTITDCSFINNTATFSGGAIRFNAYRPAITNALYEDNIAPYGSNIGSYAVKIKLVNSTSDELIQNNIGSGVKITDQIYLVLVDHYDNQMILDNTSQIRIRTSESHQSIDGTNIRRVTNGIAMFDDLTFTANPGAKGSEFLVSSAAINSEIVTADYLNSCEDVN
jgi:predicted outer membrane repeat protein